MRESVRIPADLGSIRTAIVTPFDADGAIDETAGVRPMHQLVDHGCDGLVTCGTAGGVSTLTDEEQLRMIGLAVGEMRGRCTIVAGVGSNATDHTPPGEDSKARQSYYNAVVIHAVFLAERATEPGGGRALARTDQAAAWSPAETRPETVSSVELRQPPGSEAHFCKVADRAVSGPLLLHLFVKVEEK